MATELSLVSPKSSPGGGAITSSSAPPARSVLPSAYLVRTRGRSKRTFREPLLLSRVRKINSECYVLWEWHLSSGHHGAPVREAARWLRCSALHPGSSGLHG